LKVTVFELPQPVSPYTSTLLTVATDCTQKLLLFQFNSSGTRHNTSKLNFVEPTVLPHNIERSTAKPTDWGYSGEWPLFNLLKPTCYVMQQQV